MALRAGSVGLECEARLGSCRGWGSSRPVALLSPPPEARVSPASFLAAASLGFGGSSRSGPSFSGCRSSGALAASGGPVCRGRRGSWLSSLLPSGVRSAGAASGAREDGGPVRRGTGTAVLAAATLDARRALLADLPSYGARRGVPVRAGASSLAGRLGWRLAADLELVRTRGIRLFN